MTNDFSQLSTLPSAIAMLNDYTRYQAEPGNADADEEPPFSQPRQSLWTSVPRLSLPGNQ
jgi:hypothetical protein